ncbi:unnamed protein product [Sphenostylis stenocarpa]|uniref:Phosphoribosyltransferase domain-containing protein n=1 Tax=Sphenostylis stenocarpa TaxID=92480 RepID=A0AA86VJ17_9FABA|nr:unnamed protein product [Sphenostylis stenocarpa]
MTPLHHLCASYYFVRISGGTVVAALSLLKDRGVGNKQIKVISAVSAPPALQKLSEQFPGLHVYTGIIDPEVNEKGFVPQQYYNLVMLKLFCLILLTFQVLVSTVFVAVFITVKFSQK